MQFFYPSDSRPCLPSRSSKFFEYSTYLVEVDRGLPELLVGLVEVPHTDLTEVTGVVLVEVGAVVVLTTGHTATTGMLTVLANTTVTGGDMTAAMGENSVSRLCSFGGRSISQGRSNTSALSHFTATPIFQRVCEAIERTGIDSRFPGLRETGRHLVDGAVHDKTGLSIWRWGDAVVGAAGADVEIKARGG